MPNANIDYVTSHQGTAHITTQNVIDLLAGIRGDISGVQRFPDLYNGLAHSITDVRAIQIKTGAALAGGSFFILEDAYDWLLDSGAVGYSRIDILYLVMYEDLDTQVQSCDFIYQKGTNYVNGGTGTEPSAPTGTNITATYPIMKVVITDSAIANVTDCVEDYLSNDDLVAGVANLVEQLDSDIGGTVEQVTTNKNDIAQMKVDFQDGVDTIYNAIVAQGVIPSSSTPSACAAGIATVADEQYSTGYDSGYSTAQAITWTENGFYKASTGFGFSAGFRLPTTNIVSIKITASTVGAGTTNFAFSFMTSSGTVIATYTAPETSGTHYSLNTTYNIPSNCAYIEFFSLTVRSTDSIMYYTLTRQAKKLR